MPIFRYEALDAKGNEKKGIVEALNSKDAITHVRRLGLFPTKVRPAPNLNPSADTLEIQPEQTPSVSSEGSFLLPEGSRCKMNRGIETFTGRINLWGEKGKSSLVFESGSNELQQQAAVSIDLDDIRDVEKKGFFRTSLVVKTKSGDEYIFTGNVGRMADILRFEMESRLPE